MKNKINISVLLKDCPSGMELYSPICGKCVFDRLNMGTIICKKQNTQEITFTSEGYYMLPVFNDCECMLFPSKDQRDWSKWQRPFKDGDILAYTCSYTTVFIYRNKDNEPKHTTSFYVGYNIGACSYNFHIYNKGVLIALNGDCDTRFATEEEKATLFQAIKDNGYKWNAETKTLEKLIEPKFKVGDIIRSKNGLQAYKITNVTPEYYSTKVPEHAIAGLLPVKDQDDWILIPNKFDPKTLQHFDKVLVSSNDEWFCDFFSHYDNDSIEYNCICTGGCPYDYCIPYNDDTKHLVGKSIEEAPEFYRYWEG